MLARYIALEDSDSRLPAFVEAVGCTMCNDLGVLADVVGLAAGDAAVARRRALELLSQYAWRATGCEAAVVAQLAPLLRAPDSATRVLVLRALDRLDDAAVPIAGDVVAMISDSDPAVRAAVLQAHISSAPGWSDMVVRALADPEALVRRAACEDVRRTGPRQPRLVMERVAAALRDSDEQVRAGAANALAQSAWGFEDIVVPALTAAAVNDESGITLQATHALERLERTDAIPLDRLIELLGRPDTRWAAADAIARQGVAAKEALPALVAALDDIDSHNAGHAAAALRAVGPGDERAMDGLVRLLARKDAEVYARGYAIDALAPYGDRAVPALCCVLTDASESIRRSAAAVLVRIGSGAVSELSRGLQDPDASRRAAVLAVLARIDSKATAAHAVDLLEDVDARVRAAAADVLGADGAEGTRVVAALTQRLSDMNATVRWSAARALGMLDSLPDPARAALQQALRDADPTVRETASRALQPRPAPTHGFDDQDAEVLEQLLGE